MAAPSVPFFGLSRARAVGCQAVRDGSGSAVAPSLTWFPCLRDTARAMSEGRYLVPPPADEFPDHLEHAIRAFLDDGPAAGAKALEPIRYEPPPIAPRPALSRLLQGQIFRRDRFHCRYCGGRVIPTPIMELIGGLYPDCFPYHRNWKGGQTHPAVIARSAVIDHLIPGSLGGPWTDPDNLLAACWPCNCRKSDLSMEQLGWKLRGIDESDDWDGLTRYYRRLWEAAGRPKPSVHTAWMRSLGCWDQADTLAPASPSE
jgi:hypothetical protein